MELTNKDTARKVRVTIFSKDPVDDALQTGLGLMDLLQAKRIPMGRGTYVVVGELPLNKVLEALDKGALDSPSCLGVAFFSSPPQDTGPPNVMHEQTFVSLSTLLRTLTPRQFEEGFDIRWGEVADAFA